MIFHAWNVGELAGMALPPCHMVYQFHVSNLPSPGETKRPRLSLMVYQRSCDLFLGNPFNICQQAVLLAMVVTPSGAIAVLAILTAGAQLRWRRLTLLNACQRTRPIRAGHELRGGAAWGAVAAARCVRVCAAPMTLMAVEPTLLSFVAITALVWWERFSTRRLGLRVPLALGYLLVGAGMLIGVQS